MGDTSGYKEFRQRLDTVLRRRDATALRAFLVAEGQWDAEARTDVEAAMWMMVATSPALADMRDEARRWLMEHGHAAEAGAIFGRQGGGGPGTRAGHPLRGAPRVPSQTQGEGRQRDDRRPGTADRRSQRGQTRPPGGPSERYGSRRSEGPRGRSPREQS